MLVLRWLCVVTNCATVCKPFSYFVVGIILMIAITIKFIVRVVLCLLSLLLLLFLFLLLLYVIIVIIVMVVIIVIGSIVNC